MYALVCLFVFGFVRTGVLVWRSGPSCSVVPFDDVSVLSISKLCDFAEGVCEPEGDANGLSFKDSDVMFDGFAAASFSLPVTASEAVRRPSSLRAF